MAKLSPPLKQLINAPFARPGTTPAPAGVADLYRRIANDAASRGYGSAPWLVLSAAASFTVNSPASLHQLFNVATKTSHSSNKPTTSPVTVAETIREVGLKCISFNGIPRTINSLSGFREGLPGDVVAQLATTPTRGLNTENISATNSRGYALWNSIYTPFEDKLEQKLAESHPDLPVHILGSHYGPLLSDPARSKDNGLASIGRCLTSIVAISCLRAQTGVAAQVLSHVFGLRKGVEQGVHRTEAETEEEADGLARLATDEGSEWILRSVDSICEAAGRNFAKL
ncbi:hypothetical protein SBRCBS47491_002833 [Sporothrix bragantina]|uniref:Dol-P-Man:Man(5)GlcNAc(2)-PP-Dol alpha-1,3-mannosyltransferase n=1 Tax=Sporothrix bragantina TaxID=671064 RepID=A0ABP0BA47_9PEZI